MIGVAARALARLRDRRSAKAGPQHLRTGLWGERAAARALRRKGYRILGRRVRFGPRWELDLVARDGDELVFVEVKTRRTEDFGRPVESVTADKRRAMTTAAWIYLRRLGARRPDHFRFDVVEVIGAPDGTRPEVRHIENAFSPGPELRVPW